MNCYKISIENYKLIVLTTLVVLLPNFIESVRLRGIKEPRIRVDRNYETVSSPRETIVPNDQTIAKQFETA